MKETEITIYDQNIWGCLPHGEKIQNRNALIRELVEYHNADIIAFQECAPTTSREGDRAIDKLLSDEYSEVHTDAKEKNFTPIFYKKNRFSIIESGYFAYEKQSSTMSKSLTYAVLSENESGARFGMISTHFWWKPFKVFDKGARFR